MAYQPRINCRPTGRERNVHEHVASTHGSCYSDRFEWVPKGFAEPVLTRISRRDRVEVLRQRIEDGLELFHDDDYDEVDWEDFDANFDND